MAHGYKLEHRGLNQPPIWRYKPQKLALAFSPIRASQLALAFAQTLASQLPKTSATSQAFALRTCGRSMTGLSAVPTIALDLAFALAHVQVAI